MNETRPLISIIVPVYKVEPYLRKCVDSILNQTYTNLEIILVDDGSPDNCGAICDEYAREDSRVRVIHKPNGGLSDARNAGMDIMTGSLVGFVDSDDWIEPHMYQRLYELMEQFDADMAFGGVADDVVEDDIVRTVKVSNYGEVPFAESKTDAMKRFFLGSWASWDKLYKAELFEGIRYPVGKINEDEAIALFLLERCRRVCYTNEIMYHYMKRLNSGSITMAPFTPKDLAWKDNCAANLEYIRKNHPELEQYAGKRYRSSLLWHITKISILDDCTVYGSEIREIMRELRRERPLFNKIPIDTKKGKIQYIVAMYGGFWVYRLVFRLKRGKLL